MESRVRVLSCVAMLLAGPAAFAQSITYSTVVTPSSPRAGSGTAKADVKAPAAKTPEGRLVTDALQIEAVAVDAAGRRFFADSARHTILSFPQTATAIQGVAGRNDVSGSTDGATIATALFTSPADVAVDAAGNAFVLDGSGIRKIAPDGTVSTFAGKVDQTGTADGTGVAARFFSPLGLTIDSTGNIFVADTRNCVIRKVTPAAIVTTVAGTAGVCGSADGPSGGARFNSPYDVAAAPNGAVYVADTGNATIRMISPAGQVSTLAGSTQQTERADGTGTAARFGFPSHLAVDDTGTLFVVDGIWLVRRVSAAGVVTTLAGVSTFPDGPPDNRFAFLYSIAARGDGVVYVADSNQVRSVSPNGVITTVAGTTPGQIDGPVATARFTLMSGMAFSSDGTLYLAEGMNAKTIRTLSPQGIVATIAGIYTVSGTTDGAGRAIATFNAPSGLAGTADALYIADTGNHTVRRVSQTVVSTIAGQAGISGTADGIGAVARFNGPRGLAIDGSGNVYVADTGNHAIRKIAPDGTVTTIAGQPGTAGSADGSGSVGRFNSPRSVAFAAGTIYVADTGNHTIRSISATGVVATLAGSAGSSGSIDGTGTAARFFGPSGITIGAAGIIYVADTGNHTIRAVTAAGVVTTVGGSAGSAALTDGVGGAARFSSPAGLASDAAGAVYIADLGNGAVRLGVSGVATAPAITTHPVSLTVAPRATAQFTCEATGNPSPGYVWHKSNAGSSNPGVIVDGPIYQGATTATLTVLSVSADLDGAQFFCSATNSAGSRASNRATLSLKLLRPTPAALAFGGVAVPGGGYSSLTGPQTVAIAWPGGDAPEWSVSVDQSWVQLTSTSGRGNGQFSVSVTDPGIGGSLVGTRASATITLTSPADPGYTKTIPVYFNGYSDNAPPVGVFDTPGNNATGLQGSLAVTGWAVDRIEVDRVEIWRDAVAGETTPLFPGSGPGNGKIFIANAMFVPGARPDVVAFYGESTPRVGDAGWGYMLLTQGLWNEGNGTFKLYAFAFDKAGAVSTLGTKTITIDNARATKPFGTIDTPNYGGTVSGTFHNFGWALTPGSCSITNPNVQMSIDSGPLTPVVYGDARTDVAARFGAYTNGAAAGGHFTLDTTTLTNGMHTIGWLVTDSCGRAEGIGSRFFTVANAASVATVPPSAASVAAPSPREWGLSRNGTYVAIVAAHDGTRVIQVDQTERIEVQLPGGSPYVAGALPVGSSFDEATGKFSWQPAAGFLGMYDLPFRAGSRLERIRVVVGPPIRIAVDTPKAGNVLSADGFSVAGWAVDLASLAGAGIDTLHVWAYPVGGAAPRFVGVARPGPPRPDVATLYGPFFADAGFTVPGTLPPGTYDLVVSAHSAATNRFDGAEVVRVIVR